MKNISVFVPLVLVAWLVVSCVRATTDAPPADAQAVQTAAADRARSAGGGGHGNGAHGNGGRGNSAHGNGGHGNGAQGSGTHRNAAQGNVANGNQRKQQYSFRIKNRCTSTLNVAFRLEDPVRGWKTFSWYTLAPGATTPAFKTRNPFFKYYAQSAKPSSTGSIMTISGGKACKGCWFETHDGQKYPFTDNRVMTSQAYTHQLKCGN